MKNKNVKVIDEHNIDRNATVMFSMDLNGSEYVVYWVERDEASNNIFVSKVLKNLDGTYNMLNIDDADKKKEVAEVVKYLISSAVTDQADKLVGITKTLSNGEMAKFIGVSFNKEQNINVPKTYITTVKKEVTKVVEDYYDVVSSELEIENVLTPVVETPVSVPVGSTPEVVEPITNVVTSSLPEIPTVVQQTAPLVSAVKVETPVVAQPQVVVTPTPVMNVVSEPITNVVIPETPVVANVMSTVVPTEPVVTINQPTEVVQSTVNVAPASTIPVASPVEAVNVIQQVVSAPAEVKVETPVVAQPQVVVTSTPVMNVVTAPASTMVVPETPVVANVMSTVIPTEPVAAVSNVSVESTPVVPNPVVSEPIVNTTVAEPTLVFNAAKETNLNAALGEFANTNTIPVGNINVVREFGEEAPVPSVMSEVKVEQPAVAPMVQSPSAVEPKVLVKKAGFANSKFFMVVAIAFFMASCVFLGYEVYNYFQLTK